MPALHDELVALPDPDAELAHRVARLREDISVLRLRGAVVAASGGVDSSLALAIAARACGPERVVAVALPDRHSSSESAELAQKAAASMGVTQFRVLSVDTALMALGCFTDLHTVLERVFGSFDPELHTFRTEFRYDFEISGSLPGFFAVRVGQGDEVVRRLRAVDHRALVATMNLKQRVRSVFTYRVAEELDYAVLCTTNRQEKEQGFFVKNGDGSGDVFPLHDLLKSQVRQLATAAGLPPEVAGRPSTTDTYSAPQSQESFFFRWNEPSMDLLVAAFDQGIADDAIGRELGASPQAIQRARALLERRRLLSRRLTASMGAR